jgi:hypothetical protein
MPTWKVVPEHVGFRIAFHVTLHVGFSEKVSAIPRTLAPPPTLPGALSASPD